MDQKEIKIYTTPTCPFCLMAKEFLRHKGLSYQERDVADDLEARQEMLELSGQLGVPVITVDEEVIVGFNQTMLESLLTSN
jgi:glutaredoxin 3